MQKLQIEAFLKLAKCNSIVDVRSPSEFHQGHIPGAFNIPLFSDTERAEIGTLYKKNGREAILRGLDIVGPRMSGLVRQAGKLKFDQHLLVHCWRGGMRSDSFSWLMNTGGLKAISLEGGYKKYRKRVLHGLAKPAKIILLTGSTGSGKTELIHHLKSMGEQIIDLEHLAHHKGSVFGGLGQEKQPSTEQFQNDLFQQFSQLDHSKRIWVEDESINIGMVQIPLEFWRQMSTSPFIKIDISQEVRIQRLVNEYGLFPVDVLEAKIRMISKRLGGLDTRLAIEHLHAGDIPSATGYLLKYYDKAYENCIARKNAALGDSLRFDSFKVDEIAKRIIHQANRKMNQSVYG